MTSPKVVGVGSVGQHVGDLKLFAAFGVRIAGHHDRDFAAAQIVGPRASFVDAFDPSRARRTAR